MTHQGIPLLLPSGSFWMSPVRLQPCVPTLGHHTAAPGGTEAREWGFTLNGPSLLGGAGAAESAGRARLILG